MKKLLYGVTLILLVFFIFSVKNKLFPSYFIQIDKQEYSFQVFFADSLSYDTYYKLSKIERLEKIYERLKIYICKSNCEISLFSFASIPVDVAMEGIFFRDEDAKSKDFIHNSRKQVASEQYYFSLLLEKNIVINDSLLKYKKNKSLLPWIGRTEQDGLFVEIIYAENLNPWFRPWVLRFIRDYRRFAKIYLMPFDEGVDFVQQVQTAICLKQKQVFWDLYFADKLDLQQDCDGEVGITDIQKADLAIRLDEKMFYSPKSYFEMLKNFQISYLSLKVR